MPIRLAAVAALVLLLAIVPVAGAQEKGELTFLNDAKLTLNLSKAQEGREFTLCNVGGGPAASLDARFSGFDFQRRKKLVPEKDVLEPALAETAPKTLAPGDCTDLTLRVKPGVPLDSGDYSGVLAATSAGAGVARREVTVSGPPIGKLETLGGAELEGTREGPAPGAWWDYVRLDGGGEIVLKDPGAGVTLPAKDTFVGNVSKGSEVGGLHVSGPARRNTMGVVRLPLRVDGIDEVGSYKGSLDLDPTSDSNAEIPVKLDITDAVWWAIAAIVLGAWLAAWPQLRLRRWRPERIMHERYRSLPVRYRIADSYWQGYKMKDPTLPALAPPSEESLAKYSETLDQAIRTYAKSTIFFDTSSDAYKELQASLALPEDDADCYKQRECLADALVALRTALQRLSSFLSETFPVDRQPAFVGEAALLLAPGELSVGEATERKARASDWTAFIGQWQAMADEVRRYDLWASLLGQLNDSRVPGDGMTPHHVRLLDYAHSKALEAREEMLDATDAAALEGLGSAGDLQEAYSLLSHLGAQYGVWVYLADVEDLLPEMALAVEEGTALVQTAEGIRAFAPEGASLLAAFAQVRGARAASGDQTLTGFMDGIGEFVVDSAQGLALAAGSRSVWDFVTLVLAAAVAIFAGLSLFYFGRTFGTTQDYLTVILAGAAAQLLVKTLTDTVAAQWTGVLPPGATVDEKTAPAAEKGSGISVPGTK